MISIGAYCALNTGHSIYGSRNKKMMNNCERCCYFEFCTSKGRTETKDCVYGRKGEEENGESV